MPIFTVVGWTTEYAAVVSVEVENTSEIKADCECDILSEVFSMQGLVRDILTGRQRDIGKQIVHYIIFSC